MENQLRVALERAKKAEEAFEKLKLENSQNVTGKEQKLQPLRSQQWFNNRRSEITTPHHHHHPSAREDPLEENSRH